MCKRGYGMYDVNRIRNYILYLKHEHSLYISLHPRLSEGIINSAKLMAFNIHDNSYCVLVKALGGGQYKCEKRQKRLLEKCKEGSFSDVCYAGVKEYVYPIRSEDEILGFVCVSAYRSSNEPCMCEWAENVGDTERERLSLAYIQLKEEMPKKEWVDTLISPLLDMLELAHSKQGKISDAERGLSYRVASYIKQKHSENITVEALAKHFKCSRSHLCHSFKKERGKSIKDYLTDVRIADAKDLLLYSSLSVTEIAFSVGFSDSNYFSSVFKARVGTSPLSFRKNKM